MTTDYQTSEECICDFDHGHSEECVALFMSNPENWDSYYFDK